MRLTPLGANLIVRLDAVKQETYGKSGLVAMPDKHQVPSRVGTIVALGPDVLPGLSIGDKVVVNFYNGVEVEMPRYRIMGDTIRICTARDILCKLEDEDSDDIGNLAQPK